MIKMIKMKLKNKYYVHSLLVLYVCYWPGLEDCSSGPDIVSRSLSRGFGFVMRRRKKEKKIRQEGPRATARRPFVNSRGVTLYYVRRIRRVVVFEILCELYIPCIASFVSSASPLMNVVRETFLFFFSLDDDDGSETEILFSISRDVEIIY